jgi:hypothetical protein
MARQIQNNREISIPNSTNQIIRLGQQLISSTSNQNNTNLQQEQEHKRLNLYPYTDENVDFFYHYNNPDNIFDDQKIAELNRLMINTSPNSNPEIWNKFKSGTEPKTFLYIFQTPNFRDIFNWLTDIRPYLDKHENDNNNNDNNIPRSLEYLKRIYPGTPNQMYQSDWLITDESRKLYNWKNNDYLYFPVKPKIKKELLDFVFLSKDNVNFKRFKNLDTGYESNKLYLLTHTDFPKKISSSSDSNNDSINIDVKNDEDNNINNIYCGNSQSAWEFAYSQNHAGNFEKCGQLFENQVKIFKESPFNIISINSDSKRYGDPVRQQNLNKEYFRQNGPSIPINWEPFSSSKLHNQLLALESDIRQLDNDYKQNQKYLEDLQNNLDINNFELMNEIQAYTRLNDSISDQINQHQNEYNKKINELKNIQIQPYII